MVLVVEKFGGSSVSDAAKIRHVAGRIATRAATGDRVVAVVSAMGNRTDELIALATEVTVDPRPPPGRWSPPPCSRWHSTITASTR